MGLLEIILLSICILLLTASAVYLETTETKLDWAHFFLLIAIVVFGILMGRVSEKEAYKEGQIDALKGDYKYEMVIGNDTTYVEK